MLECDQRDWIDMSHVSITICDHAAILFNFIKLCQDIKQRKTTAWNRLKCRSLLATTDIYYSFWQLHNYWFFLYSCLWKFYFLAFLFFDSSYFYFSIVDAIGLQLEYINAREALCVKWRVTNEQANQTVDATMLKNPCGGDGHVFVTVKSRVEGGKNVKTHTWSYSHWINVT